MNYKVTKKYKVIKAQKAKERLGRNKILGIIASDKEGLHNPVAIENIGPFIDTNLPPPRKVFQGRNYSGRMT